MVKKGYIILGTIVLLILIIIIGGLIWYKTQTTGTVKKNASNGDSSNIEVIDKDMDPHYAGTTKESTSNETIIEIASGTSTADILKLLKSNNLIKNELAAKIYIKLHEVKNLQAGKYAFNGDEELSEVLKILTEGRVMDETVTITFKEGKNMRYIASTIAEKTNNKTNDVYKLLANKEYIQALIDKYWFITSDVQNTDIYYPLEGYLYPDTYSFSNEDVDVKTIFEKMLDQMDKVLTKYKEVILDSDYSIHDIVTMSSIVELEGNNATNRSKIACVIYNRLKSKMSLGSDVTTYYAVKVEMGKRDLYTKEINTYNAYNTRGPNMEGKLPVGPIGNVSEESIKAVLKPDNNKYLYFVADKNGEIYFSNTYQEHQDTIATLQKRGLWYEYDN